MTESQVNQLLSLLADIKALLIEIEANTEPA